MRAGFASVFTHHHGLSLVDSRGVTKLLMIKIMINNVVEVNIGYQRNIVNPD